ncbi:MAG: hypothetical protein IJ564_04535 [Alphaproteobacteria bacterium]|nr:hypothetical protein [Alphaproteobacteria bacterium]
MSLLKDISTDVIKLLCWIGFFIALFFIATTAFYDWDFYINLEQNTKLIQECMDEGNSEEVCNSRVC